MSSSSSSKAQRPVDSSPISEISDAPWRDTVSPQALTLLELASLTDGLTALGASAPRHEVDVVVIGGGVTGLSAAQAVSAAGLRTLLLDAAPRLGAGASGRNAGILSAGANAPLSELAPGSPVAALWPETTRILLDLLAEAEKPGSLLNARRTGALNIATSRAAARRIASEARARHAVGLRADVWTAAQVAQVTNGRLDTREITAALWLPDEGRIHPWTLLATLARRARKAGAQLVGNARVSAQIADENRRRHGRWRIAAPGANDQSAMTVYARGLIDATGPTVAPSARLYALAFMADLPDDFPLFWDAAPYVYYDYRAGDGRLIVSGGRYGRVGASERDSAYHTRMAEAARRWLPELAGQPPRYAWAVDIDTASDRLPGIQPLAGDAPGLTVVGLGAQGVLPGIALGRQAGERLAAQLGKR
ncbi:MAG TPA: FAD-dependent oxidoreductase [Ktedonobacterales bacterium]|nr:FAD-dependent oxidoreductase [Ktedonobacterales bacterium]